MIKMIVAVSKNGVIGKAGSLPWRIPEDLKRFKQLTIGGTLFVGSTTAKTLPPLKDRELIVLSRNGHSIADMNVVAAGRENVWLIGGAQIYNAALEVDVVNRVYLTLVDKEYDGDTFFDYETITKNSKWVLASEEILREQDPVVRLQVWDRVEV